MADRVQTFRLPDLGEGLTEGEILQWLVQPGDRVRLNQTIVEVETAKAAVEVPSPFSGVVLELHWPAGSTVDVGAPLISFDTEPDAGPLDQRSLTGGAGAAAGGAGGAGAAAGGVGGAGGAAAGGAGGAGGASANPVESVAAQQAVATGTVSQVAADTVPAAAAPLVDRALDEPTPQPRAFEPGLVGSPAPKMEAPLIGETGPTGRTQTLVGYGPRSVTAKRRPRVAAPAQPVVTDAPKASRIIASEVSRHAQIRAAEPVVRAKPPVRKLAKDLGLDLAELTGTGPDGTITRSDVEAAAAPAPVHPLTAAPAYDSATRERRIPVKGVRRLTAQAMVASAFTAPHVTEFVTLDITPTMELRQQVGQLPEFAGVKVTPLLFVAKALLLAVARHPDINTSWDEAAQEIVVKDYVNLGIAAATPRGLIVPNIKDADMLSLPELARALQVLTETAKAGRTPPADMRGGTITITNVGVFGVDNGTAILNPGEAAILCFGAVRPMPWAHQGQIAVRQVTQLSLSFDHRLVDGQLGSQFLHDVARVLSDPATALLWA